jgi:hypothetical protein
VFGLPRREPAALGQGFPASERRMAAAMVIGLPNTTVNQSRTLAKIPSKTNASAIPPILKRALCSHSIHREP